MMMNMGYSRKEIEESLVQQKYNDVMATYLLLARRGSDVSCIACLFYSDTSDLIHLSDQSHMAMDESFKVLPRKNGMGVFGRPYKLSPFWCQTHIVKAL